MALIKLRPARHLYYPMNPKLPFSTRKFRGKWRFVAFESGMFFPRTPYVEFSSDMTTVLNMVV